MSVRGASVRYLLHGSEQSLYSGKIRMYLRYRQLPFREVLCTRRAYKEAIIPSVGWAVVPCLERLDGGDWLQDTTTIIDTLEADLSESAPERSVVPEGPAQRFAARLLNFFADEWLLLPAMHYRWSFPENEAFLVHEFGLVSAGPDATPEVRDKAGTKAFQAFRATVTSGILGINQATIPGLEASYKEFLGELSTHLDRHQYVLGDRPSIGDFGLMAPLYAHLARDPVPAFLMKTTAPRVHDYVERMNGWATSRVSLLDPEREGDDGGDDDREAWSRVSTVRGGGWIEDDGVPDSLVRILARQATEQLPVARDSSAALGALLRAQENGGDGKGGEEDRCRLGLEVALPGGIGGLAQLGGFESNVYGVKTQLSLRPNVTMMAQDLTDRYHETSDGVEGGREAVDALLHRVALAAGSDPDALVALFADRTILGGCPRLERRNYQLFRADAP